MTIRLSTWIAAGSAAIVLHLLLLAAILWFTSTAAIQATQQQSVSVSLENLGAAPQATAAPSSDQAQESAPSAAAPAPASTDAPAAQAAAPAPPAPSANASSPGIQTVQAASVVATAQAEPASALAPSASESEQQPAAQPSQPAAEAKAPTPPNTSANTESTTAKNAGAAPDQSAPVGSTAQTSDQYIQDLRSKLESLQSYPEQARRSNVQGTVVLHLIFDRAGNLVRAAIQRSSGSSQLDQAALAAAKKAAPIGRMPSAMQRTRLDILIPIRYTLQNP